MQLYNSLSGRKETFTPADPGRPTMYVCGPTVHNHPHIGNARPAVVFDVLFRLLKHRFGDVLYVRNVTDIDDKIMAAAAAEGVATEVIARRYAAAYHEDLAALNVLPPTVEPYATGHVPQMIAMILRLIARGHAYEAEGHVLFHVPSFSAYGALSWRSREEMIDLARCHQDARAQENQMEDLSRRSSESLRNLQRPSRRRGAAHRIRQHRQTSGIPQAALARRLDVPIWKLSRLERGLDPIPVRLIATVVAMLTGEQPSENSKRRSRRLTMVG